MKQFNFTIKTIDESSSNQTEETNQSPLETVNESKNKRIVLKFNELSLILSNSSFLELLQLLREYFEDSKNFKKYKTTKDLWNKLIKENGNLLIQNTLAKILEKSVDEIEAELSKITTKV